MTGSRSIQKTLKVAALGAFISAGMIGTSFGQAAGGGGGGGGSGGQGGGSPAFDGRLGPVPNNANRIRHGGPIIIDPPHPRRPAAQPETRGCTTEQRNSRNNTNQIGCTSPRNRVVE